MKEVCARYHIRSMGDNCEAYQKPDNHPFPACHPCQGCEKRTRKQDKNQTPLRMRQGGRHKKPPDQIKADKAAFSLTYYHNHKNLKGIQPRKEHTNPTVIVCKGCGITKPSGEFYQEAKCSNGHRPKCKACENAIRAGNARKARGDRGK